MKGKPWIASTRRLGRWVGTGFAFVLATSALVSAQEMGTSDLPIGPRDVLEIRVFGLTELDLDTRVRADGTIEMPLIGAVAAGDLTVPELEAAIEGRLQAGRFVRDPQVAVFVREMISRMVSIQGEVEKPGVYALIGGGTLVEMIAAAGGVTEEAGERVVVRRPDGEVAYADGKALLQAGDLESDLVLRPGDTVVVTIDPVEQVLVSGAVREEGEVEFRASAGMTVLRAVTSAGGVTSKRAARRVTIVRKGPDGVEERLASDLRAIQQGQASDLELQPGDLVVVGP